MTMDKIMNRREVVRKVSSVALAGFMALQVSGVYAAETEEISNLNNINISQQAKLYANEGMDKLKIAQKILDNKNVGLYSIEEEYDELGSKISSSLYFNMKGNNLRDISSQIEQEILNENTVNQLIEVTEANKVPMVTFRFSGLYDGENGDVERKVCQFINIKNIDVDRLERSDKWFVNKLKLQKISSILGVDDNDWYLISNKKDKISIRKSEKDRTMERCLNIKYALSEYKSEEYKFVTTLRITDMKGIFHGEYAGSIKGDKILTSAWVHKGSEIYDLSEINCTDKLEQKLTSSYRLADEEAVGMAIRELVRDNIR